MLSKALSCFLRQQAAAVTPGYLCADDSELSLPAAGETIFPLEGQQGMARLAGIDYKKCADGLKYLPRAGDAVLFYSVHPNGTFDKHALHGGCPVIEGEKWCALLTCKCLMI